MVKWGSQWKLYNPTCHGSSNNHHEYIGGSQWCIYKSQTEGFSFTFVEIVLRIYTSRKRNWVFFLHMLNRSTVLSVIITTARDVKFLNDYILQRNEKRNERSVGKLITINLNNMSRHWQIKHSFTRKENHPLKRFRLYYISICNYRVGFNCTSFRSDCGKCRACEKTNA